MRVDILVAVILVILACLFLPFLIIWSLNALFPVLAIPYTLKTWFAVIVLGGFFSVTKNRKTE